MSKKFNSKKAQAVLRDLEENHQHSIYDEVYLRNKKCLNRMALFYRGNYISYRELFEKVENFADSLYTLGYRKGDEIPVCMKMSPEFIYMFLAISKIGAVINAVGEWFNSEYLESILRNTGSKYIFITSNVFEKIKQSIGDSGIKYVVYFDLDISLKDKKNPYEGIDSKFIDCI